VTDFVLVVRKPKERKKKKHECVEQGFVNLLQKESKPFQILCIFRSTDNMNI